MIKQGLLDEGKTVLSGVAEVFDADANRGEESARAWWRIGMAEWEKGGESTCGEMMKAYTTNATALVE